MVYGAFEWDAGKASTNLRKHGVAFEEASTFFADPSYILMADPGDERRYLALGTSGLLRVLMVVHVERGPRIRLISAQKATSDERKTYEKRHSA